MSRLGANGRRRARRKTPAPPRATLKSQNSISNSETNITRLHERKPAEPAGRVHGGSVSHLVRLFSIAPRIIRPAGEGEGKSIGKVVAARRAARVADEAELMQTCEVAFDRRLAVDADAANVELDPDLLG